MYHVMDLIFTTHTKVQRTGRMSILKMWKCFYTLGATLIVLGKANMACASEPTTSLRALQWGTCTTLTNVKVECNSTTSTDQKVSFKVAGGLAPYKINITCDSNPTLPIISIDSAGDKSTVIPYCAGDVAVSAKGSGYCPASVVKVLAATTPDCCYNDIKCKLDPAALQQVAGCNTLMLVTAYPRKTVLADVFTVNPSACSPTKLALTFDRTQTPSLPAPQDYCPSKGGVSVKRIYHVTPYDRAGNALTTSKIDCTENFLVKHTTPPVFSGLCETTPISNITIGCGTTGSVDFTLPSDCHAKGVCSNMEVSVKYGGSLEGVVLHRTWTATDFCGNKNTKTQDIMLTNAGCQ